MAGAGLATLVGEMVEAGAVDVGNIEDYGTEVTDTKSADWNEELSPYSKPEKA